MSRRAAYVAWVAASGIAGLIVGLASSCDAHLLRGLPLAVPRNVWLGLAVLGAPSAVLLAPLIRVFGGRAFDWAVLTFVGVLLCYFSTFLGFVVYVIAVSYITPLLPPGYSEQPLWAVLSTTIPAFIGGSALAVVQLPALRTAARWKTWIIATMLGSAALGPLTFAAIGFVSCDVSYPSTALLGIAGGLLYGVVTAMALGMRLSTWTRARQRPPVVT
jgi:hypothetical protein